MSESTESKIDWLQKKINYGATYKGMITLIIVWEFVIVLFLSTFSEPILNILGIDAWISLDDSLEAKAARLVMLYHALTVPFIAVCTFFALMVMDVREKFKSRVKWPLFIGSLLTSAMGVLYAYFFPGGWILHGLYLVGLSLCFYAGLLLLLGVFPTKSFPKRDPEAGRNIVIAQIALTITTVCVLLSTILGASIGAFFGNEDLTAFLAEYYLREPYPDITIAHLFVDGVKGHLHVMLALIDSIILLVVYRYTVPDQKGKWYQLSMILSIPGVIILSMGSWLVTFKSIAIWPFDMHYLIYVGSGILVTVGFILTLTGWNLTSKRILGDEYESASWLTRAKAVFKAPLHFAMYWQFIWVNFVMTFTGIFLALSLRPDSVIPEKILVNLPSFREGPIEVETTVARGHWHILGVLSAVILLLLLIDMLDIQGTSRKAMSWLLYAGSVVAFGFGVIYLYLPHFNTEWAFNVNLFVSVRDMYNQTAPWLPLAMEAGIMLIAIAIVIFCFHQLFDIIKGKRDVEDWPE